MSASRLHRWAPLILVAALVAGCSSGGGSEGAVDRSTSTTSRPPATGPGSRERPVPLSTAAAVSDRWQVKVVETIADAGPSLREAGETDATAPAGRQLFLATVDITCVGGGAASPQFALTFTALDQAGTYSNLTDGCGVIPDPIPASDIVTGTTVRGSVCWAVRTEALASLQMLVNAGFLETDQVHFALR